MKMKPQKNVARGTVWRSIGREGGASPDCPSPSATPPAPSQSLHLVCSTCRRKDSITQLKLEISVVVSSFVHELDHVREFARVQNLVTCYCLRIHRKFYSKRNKFLRQSFSSGKL